MAGNSQDDILIWGSSSDSSNVINENNKSNDFDGEKGYFEELDVPVQDTTVEENSAELLESTLVEDEFGEASSVSVYEKKYYKISEVESIIGESQSTIRFWEDSFSELGKNFCSLRSRGGTRKFTKENIENLKLLKLLLRERRLTIEGAISEVKNAKKRNAKERTLLLLDEMRDELNDLIDAYNLYLQQKCE